MNKGIYIIDTTLRDGEQSPGKVFTNEQKLKIAKYLDKSGIYQIECGIPAMGEEERDCIKNIILQCENSIISTWNRLNVEDIKHSILCRPDIIHISIPSSKIQIYDNLHKDEKWIKRTIEECIYVCNEYGYDPTIGFEDASRADIEYLLQLSSIVEELGVRRIRYSDTVGILSLSKTRNDIRKLRKNSDLEIEIHAHNDFGMAVAVSIEAAKNGAEYINCTIDGIGERCGNCNMQKFLESTEGLYNNPNINKHALIAGNLDSIINTI